MIPHPPSSQQRFLGRALEPLRYFTWSAMFVSACFFFFSFSLPTHVFSDLHHPSQDSNFWSFFSQGIQLWSSKLEEFCDDKSHEWADQECRHFRGPWVGSLTLKSHFCCPLVGSHASRTPLLWWSETPLFWSFGGKPYSLKTPSFSWVIRNATFVAPLWEALL